MTYHCYNNDDFESFKDVDPTNTNTKIVINGGEFGSTTTLSTVSMAEEAVL